MKKTKKNDIVNYVHLFTIGQQEIILIINRRNGLWRCDISQGETGTGTSTGGSYKNIMEYCEKMEKQHRYSYNFFTQN